MRSAHTSEASIKVLTVKILFDFHELRSSLFERTVRLGSSMRNAKCEIQKGKLTTLLTFLEIKRLKGGRDFDIKRKREWVKSRLDSLKSAKAVEIQDM